MKGKPHLIPAVIVAVMLCVALAPLAYGYYQVLRWVTCGVAVFIAVMAYRWGKVWAMGVFGLIAVLFNPIWPIHLTKNIWMPIDLMCAALFVTGVFVLRKPVQPR
jgi:hypothetical protein